MRGGHAGVVGWRCRESVKLCGCVRESRLKVFRSGKVKQKECL